MDVDFKMNGTVFLRFNQEIMKPQLGSGRLLDEIDEFVAAVFEFEMEVNNDDVKEELEYQPLFRDWGSWEIEFFVNFSDPLLVSQGRVRDKFRVQVLRPDFIISKSTNKPLQVDAN